MIYTSRASRSSRITRFKIKLISSSRSSRRKISSKSSSAFPPIQVNRKVIPHFLLLCHGAVAGL